MSKRDYYDVLGVQKNASDSDIKKAFRNLAKENQKSGIMLNRLNDFHKYCTKELSLNVIGLMCLPPPNSNSDKYFKVLKKSAEQLNLKDLSMGMSSDYEQAILCGSTYLRLGTVIFGERST